MNTATKQKQSHKKKGVRKATRGLASSLKSKKEGSWGRGMIAFFAWLIHICISFCVDNHPTEVGSALIVALKSFAKG